MIQVCFEFAPFLPVFLVGKSMREESVETDGCVVFPPVVHIQSRSERQAGGGKDTP